MKRMFAMAAFLSAFLLSSCSFYAQFNLHNNTQGTVNILRPNVETPVSHGTARRFAAPLVRDNRTGAWIIGGDLVVSAGSCLLTFSVDEVDSRLQETQSEHVIPMQLESNFDLYILPFGARLPAQGVELEEARTRGSVLRPSVSNCGPR